MQQVPTTPSSAPAKSTPSGTPAPPEKPRPTAPAAHVSAATTNGRPATASGAAPPSAPRADIAHLNGNAPEKEEEGVDDDNDDFPEEDVETFPAGHEVAVAIAEDIYPSAIDYFMADTIDSDDELDGINIDDSDDDDVEMS